MPEPARSGVFGAWAPGPLLDPNRCGYAVVMSVQPEELAARLRLGATETAARSAARAALIEARLPEAVATLKGQFNAEYVWLVGSFARGDTHIESDVDLVVLGLAPAGIDRAGAQVEAIPKCPVDLVRVENCLPSMWQTVTDEGRPL